MEMRSSRGLCVLLVCLTICASSPVSTEALAAPVDDLVLIQTSEDRTQNHLQNHDILAAAAAKQPLIQTTPQDDVHAQMAALKQSLIQTTPQDDAHAKMAALVKHAGLEKRVSHLESQAAEKAESPPPPPEKSEDWQCAHCVSTCKTQKCKDFCQHAHCKENAPLFQDTAANVPAHASNAWKCGHCNSVCKTAQCKSWCSKFWCAVGAGPHDVFNLDSGKALPAPKVGVAKNQMPLLSLTKNADQHLREMEQKTNAMIQRSNRDVTGETLRAALNAIGDVLKIRETSNNLFKEMESKTSERDSMRYSKDKYRKWSAQATAIKESSTKEAVAKAQEETTHDKVKEVKYKARANLGSAALRVTDKLIESDTKNYEVAEAVAAVKEEGSETPDDDQ